VLRFDPMRSKTVGVCKMPFLKIYSFVLLFLLLIGCKDQYNSTPNGSVGLAEIDYCSMNSTNTPFAFGDGTVGSPYGICTAAQLNNVGADAAYLDKNFKLYADIDLLSYTANSFTFIGTSVAPFLGTFDGNGKVISNLTYSDSSAAGDHAGFFRKIGPSGVVKNLGLIAVNITGRSIVGALAGENVGIVDNCFAKGAVTGAGRVGGLIGRFWETSAATYVLNSYAEVNVSGTGFVGGLIGWVRGTVTGSHAIGNVTSAGDRIGGLVGTVDQGTIIGSYAQGNVTGRDLVGGLIGTIGGSISTSHATSTIICRAWCGGITGNIGYGSGSGLISKSYAHSTITSSGYSSGGLWASAGGITGYGYANYNIENCYASVTVNTTGADLGGIAGWTGGTITNSYAIPSYGSNGTPERGGLNGELGGAIIGSFWNSDIDTTVVNTEGATANTVGASTTLEMKTAQTYITAGWSSSIWNLQDGEYPTLK
jgi:hypothetical protein